MYSTCIHIYLVIPPWTSDLQHSLAHQLLERLDHGFFFEAPLNVHGWQQAFRRLQRVTSERARGRDSLPLHLVWPLHPILRHRFVTRSPETSCLRLSAYGTHHFQKKKRCKRSWAHRCWVAVIGLQWVFLHWLALLWLYWDTVLPWSLGLDFTLHSLLSCDLLYVWILYQGGCLSYTRNRHAFHLYCLELHQLLPCLPLLVWYTGAGLANPS